jgi:acyl-CoA synthetase (AMP-forming)/AMP-acid ligase II
MRPTQHDDASGASILGRLISVAARTPERLAVADPESSLTFAQLLARVRELALRLRATGAGRVLALALPSGPEFTALQLASFAAGSAAMPLPPRATAAEASRAFAIVPPDLLAVGVGDGEKSGVLASLPGSCSVIAGGRLAAGPTHPAAKSAAASLPAGTALIQFTSGSTGAPRAILLDEAAVIAALRSVDAHLRTFGEAIVFSPVPQAHAMGNALVLEHLLAGHTVQLSSSPFQGEHLRQLEKSGATAIHASPGYFRQLLRLPSFSPARLPRLRDFTLGSDRSDPTLLSEIRTRFPEVRIHTRYGLSEAFGPLALHTSLPGTPIPVDGAIGPPLLGVEFRAEALPEEPAHLRLLTRTGAAARKALRPDGSTEPLMAGDGWLDTGDLVTPIADGGWRFVGRRSQFIKVNGFRVSPLEIEETLLQAPGVAEASVVSIPHPATGEMIVACLVPAPSPATPPTAAGLHAHCAARLSAAKVPAHFLIDLPLPRTVSGKVARAELARLIAARLAPTSPRHLP